MERFRCKILCKVKLWTSINMFQEYLRYKNVSTNIRKNENKASIKNILNITSKFYHE